MSDKPRDRDHIAHSRHDQKRQQPSHRGLRGSRIHDDECTNIPGENKKKRANGVDFGSAGIQEFDKSRHRRGKSNNRQEKEQ
ncbi:MAG: hypothetical protein JO236_21870 [Mycobacterium sp.]|uniref:hypothetical protein n=1 Tax=Mycobacterium sp. TaxID=1785 RepID=UPI001ED05FF1|nr:hypothetical protein [Mycobacterium sp.]MBW0020169.1 hypothetical protein [Mycobacterium sp.]